MGCWVIEIEELPGSKPAQHHQKMPLIETFVFDQRGQLARRISAE